MSISVLHILFIVGRLYDGSICTTYSMKCYLIFFIPYRNSKAYPKKYEGVFLVWYIILYPHYSASLSWWRQQMETFSALLALSGGNLAGHRMIPLTQASDAEFWCFLWSEKKVVLLFTRHRWFETPWRSLWRHCNYWRWTTILCKRRNINN